MTDTGRAKEFCIRTNSLKRKVDDAIELIRDLTMDSRAVVFSSFGKDSLALLSLVAEAHVNLDIAYFELGIVPGKHIFGRRLAARLAKPAHLLRPHRTTLVRGESDDSLAYHFDLASGGSIRILGATFDDADHPDLLCGVQSNLVRSGEHPPYPWDTIFCGRRASDQDVTVGSLWWDAPVEPVGGSTRVAMPLLRWSDEDLLRYLDSRSIKPDPSRYERSANILRDQADKTTNPDHLACCIKCLAAERGQQLHCPLSGSLVTSFSELRSSETFTPGAISPAVLC